MGDTQSAGVSIHSGGGRGGPASRGRSRSMLTRFSGRFRYNYADVAADVTGVVQRHANLSWRWLAVKERERFVLLLVVTASRSIEPSDFVRPSGRPFLVEVFHLQIDKHSSMAGDSRWSGPRRSLWPAGRTYVTEGRRPVANLMCFERRPLVTPSTIRRPKNIPVYRGRTAKKQYLRCVGVWPGQWVAGSDCDDMKAFCLWNT